MHPVALVPSFVNSVMIQSFNRVTCLMESGQGFFCPISFNKAFDQLMLEYTCILCDIIV